MINKNRRAFTFIELSVLITVIAIIFTFSLVIKDRLDDINKNQATERKILKIRDAISAYYQTNGKVPCPARLDYDIYNANFGNVVADNGYGCASSAGVFAFGGDGNGDGKSDLYIGAVPVVALGLNKEDALDGWGRKISYVVSALVRNIYNETSDFPVNNHLSCWLDFSDGSSLTLREDSSFYYISNVADKSATGNCAAEQDNNAYQPQIKAENIATSTLIGAYFDGVNDYLEIKNGTIHDLFQSSHTLFFVANFDHDATTHRALLSYGNSGNPNAKGLYYTDKDSGNLSFKSLQGASPSHIIGLLSDAEPEVFSLTRSGNYILNPYINYVDQGSISVGYGLTGGINTLIIGKDLTDTTANFIFAKEVFEFIAYKTPLSDAQIKEVLEYLYAKWNSNKVKQNRIVIKDSAGTSRSKADIVLISHGANGLGSYNSAGKQIDFSNLSAADLEYNNIARASGMNVDIYSDFLGSNYNLGEGWRKGFDDIVRYYNIFELRTVTGR